jgi:hypothetical protein
VSSAQPQPAGAAAAQYGGSASGRPARRREVQLVVPHRPPYSGDREGHAADAVPAAGRGLSGRDRLPLAAKVPTASSRSRRSTATPAGPSRATSRRPEGCLGETSTSHRPTTRRSGSRSRPCCSASRLTAPPKALAPPPGEGLVSKNVPWHRPARPAAHGDVSVAVTPARGTRVADIQRAACLPVAIETQPTNFWRAEAICIDRRRRRGRDDLC